MYFTHHFAHHETLSRAQSWLAQLGFGPNQVEAHTDGVPRLALAIEPQRLGQIELLINAVERTDPDGHPGIWHRAHQVRVYPEGAGPGDARESLPPHSAPIGWHPQDQVHSAHWDRPPIFEGPA